MDSGSADGFLFMRRQDAQMGTILNIIGQDSLTPQLTWNATTGVDHYQIYRDDQLIGTSTTSTYTDTLPAVPASYMYHVIPIWNAGSPADPSSLAQVLLTLRTPTGLSAVSPTNNAPVLTWDGQPVAVGYIIYREDTFTGSTVQAGTSTTNNFTDIHTPGIFNYTVVAQDSSGRESEPSEPLNVVVTTAPGQGSRTLTAQGQTEVIPSQLTDMLPGLQPNNTRKASFDFDLSNAGGTLNVKRPLTFTFNANGQAFFLESTNISWLLIDEPGNSRGTFRGLADVTVDGTTTSGLPFVATAIDGSLTTPASPHNLKLTVYSDTSLTSVLYSVHQDLSKGKIKIN